MERLTDDVCELPYLLELRAIELDNRLLRSPQCQAQRIQRKLAQLQIIAGLSLATIPDYTLRTKSIHNGLISNPPKLHLHTSTSPTDIPIAMPPST